MKINYLRSQYYFDVHGREYQVEFLPDKPGHIVTIMHIYGNEYPVTFKTKLHPGRVNAKLYLEKHLNEKQP